MPVAPVVFTCENEGTGTTTPHTKHLPQLVNALAYEMLPGNCKNEIAQLIANMEAKTDTQPPLVAHVDDEDIPPRQLRFWEDQS